ncbi:hypothetical protein J4E80_005852 [Alternaria sp. BMP 0032]|nr:hypothetical protein J4E80_005852 [Alternaria sp. BMP 0032]
MADATRAADAHLAARSSHEENTNITTHNATESPLLQLPAEMRNEIYKYVLSGQVHEILLRPRAQQNSLGLVLVCRQIAEEAAMLQYPYCTFAFDHWLAIENFSSRCPPAKRKLIRTIQLKPRRWGMLERTFWNFGRNGSYVNLEELEGLKTIIIEKASVAPAAGSRTRGEQQDIRALAETMRSMKESVTVILEE